MTLALALVAAAVSIGSVHTLAPDHWMPFGALARSERWSAKRTAAITALCGLGHVTGSVVLGLLSVYFGLEVLERFGRHIESVSGLLLIGFGVAYAVWGLHGAVSGHTHIHSHGHGNSHDCSRQLWPFDRRHQAIGHSHQPLPISHVTPWSLFLLFSADPCVAVIPLIFAAAPLGWPTLVAVIVAYEIATIGTMVLLVLPARAAASAVRGTFVDRYGDALAGGVVATVGIAVLMFGE
jgi:nickel/cobalt transporter (NicO) family protein